MIHLHAVLFHHLFQIPVAQRVSQILTDAGEDDVDAVAFAVDHAGLAVIFPDIRFLEVAGRIRKWSATPRTIDRAATISWTSVANRSWLVDPRVAHPGTRRTTADIPHCTWLVTPRSDCVATPHPPESVCGQCPAAVTVAFRPGPLRLPCAHGTTRPRLLGSERRPPSPVP